MIRERFKGFHEDDDELTEEFIFWFMASHFNFTASEVNKMPYDRVLYHIILEKENEKNKIEIQKNVLAEAFNKAFAGR